MEFMELVQQLGTKISIDASGARKDAQCPWFTLLLLLGDPIFNLVAKFATNPRNTTEINFELF